MFSSNKISLLNLIILVQRTARVCMTLFGLDFFSVSGGQSSLKDTLLQARRMENSIDHELFFLQVARYVPEIGNSVVNQAVSTLTVLLTSENI